MYWSISINDELAQQFAELVRQMGYENRSAAVCAMLHHQLKSMRTEQQETLYCAASVSYIFNHHTLNLTRRLMDLKRLHHYLVVAAMHVHLDDEECMETIVLRGATGEVSTFANSLIALRDVRHGRVNIVLAEMSLHRSVNSHIPIQPRP